MGYFYPADIFDHLNYYRSYTGWVISFSCVFKFSFSMGFRFINVNLYGFVAFIILKIGTLLQLFAFEAEIERYDQIINTDGSIKNMDLLLTYSSSGIMSFGLVIVCF
jgi:hypothetical protein